MSFQWSLAKVVDLLKMTLKSILHLPEWLRSKTQVTAHAGKDVEQGEHSSIAGGNRKMQTISESSLLVAQKTGNSSTSRLSYILLGNMPWDCSTRALVQIQELNHDPELRS